VDNQALEVKRQGSLVIPTKNCVRLQVSAIFWVLFGSEFWSLFLLGYGGISDRLRLGALSEEGSLWVLFLVLWWLEAFNWAFCLFVVIVNALLATSSLLFLLLIWVSMGGGEGSLSVEGVLVSLGWLLGVPI